MRDRMVRVALDANGAAVLDGDVHGAGVGTVVRAGCTYDAHPRMTLHPPAGLCDSCRWQKLIRNTRGSTFSMCRNPELPKYPRLPVKECRGYEPGARSDA